MPPCVSILVPARNAGGYLDTALKSVSVQSFADYEVLIGDDASTDTTGEVASAWAARDSRIRVIRNSERLGMTVNWNALLRQAGGEFMVKLDADDAMAPEAIRQLLVSIRCEPGMVAAFCRTAECDEDLGVKGVFLGEQAFAMAGLDPARNYVKRGKEWYPLCFLGYQPWHSNAQMHRRTELLRLGGWDEQWGCAADTDLILRILERDCPVVHNPCQGFLYRRRPGSVSHGYREQGLLGWENALIHLRSLSRFFGRNRPPLELRKAWWRIWQDLKALQREMHLSAAPAEEVDRLARLAGGTASPPRMVLLEGWLRQTVWNWRERTSK